MMRTGKYKGGYMDMLQSMIIIVLPKVANMLGLSFFDSKATSFIVSVIKNQLKERQNNPTGNKRNDFIDILVAALNASENEQNAVGKEEDQFDKDALLNGGSINKKPPAFTQSELEDVIVCNAFLLFFAGFDTTSTGMAQVLYQLAKNPKVQDQLYEELLEAAEKSGGKEKLGYNEIQTLPYLEMVVLESLRSYSPITPLERECAEDYHVPGTDYVIEKGVIVQIPVPKM